MQNWILYVGDFYISNCNWMLSRSFPVTPELVEGVQRWTQISDDYSYILKGVNIYSPSSLPQI